jgi:hypothetical protein
MTSPSLIFLLTVPAVLLILASSIILMKEKKGKGGSMEMVVGAALMVISVVGSLSIYYYAIHHQYQFEQDLKSTYLISKYLVKLMPVGLLILSIGLTRHTELPGRIFKKGYK